MAASVGSLNIVSRFAWRALIDGNRTLFVASGYGVPVDPATAAYSQLQLDVYGEIIDTFLFVPRPDGSGKVRARGFGLVLLEHLENCLGVAHAWCWGSSWTAATSHSIPNDCLGLAGPRR